MPMRQRSRKVYKTAQGKVIDMDMLRQKNELVPAVGNARVNARGDELGPGGKIVRTREEILKDYYENSAGIPDEVAVRDEPVTQSQELDTVDNKSNSQKKKTTKKEEATINTDKEWVEDQEGNFYQKENK